MDECSRELALYVVNAKPVETNYSAGHSIHERQGKGYAPPLLFMQKDITPTVNHLSVFEINQS